jgi:tetratricopeptide (TPR) repeat protein
LQWAFVPGSLARVAPKEINMKRSISLWLGMLAFALLPALTQTPASESKKTSEAELKDEAVIRNINADIKTVIQDFSDAVSSNDPAVKIAKYRDAETIMLRDTAAKPDASTLWVQLGQAQAGLGETQNDTKKYDEAIVSLKKSLDTDAAAKKPSGSIQAAAYSTLGEIYARTGRIPDANAAFDSAAKANPTMAAIYLKNEAVIFSQMASSAHQAAAQAANYEAEAAAADEAIKANPKFAVAYYLKAVGLLAKATVDSKTNRYVAPPGCIEAYQKYLELAPQGAYADDVRATLDTLARRP